MYRLTDWVFQKHVPWQVTFLISVFIGFILVAFLFPSTLESEEPNKYFLAFLGYPIWIFIKSIYWKERYKMISKYPKGSPKYNEHMKSLMKYNYELYSELKIEEELGFILLMGNALEALKDMEKESEKEKK